MTSRTSFAGLEVLAPGDLPSSDGYRFQSVNPVITARLLQLGAVLHKHDAHSAAANPAVAPTAANKATGGTIPAGLDLSVGFTWMDDQGGETLLSPVETVETVAAIIDPQKPPEAEADYATGTLPVANFDYGITVSDGLGGETALSPVASLQLLPNEHRAVKLSGLKVLLEEVAPGIGAAEWRVWRSQNGGPRYLMAHGKTATVLDDGSLTGDCTVSPPNSSTALGTNELKVTVTEEAPANAGFFQLYISPDGSFTGPCLIAQYPLTELGKVIKLTTLALTAGTPPPVTLSVPGAGKINPDTEMLAFPFKKAVGEPSELPTEGNEDGDVREALSNHTIYIWDGEASEWNASAGGGEGGVRVENPEGTLMPAEPKLQFAGDVAVTDDAAHNRTVITVTAGTFTYEGPWAAEPTYHPGDIVARGGGSYLALAETKGNDPTTDEGVHWGILAMPGAEGGGGVAIVWRGAWSNITTYAKDDMVSHGGSSYISLIEENLNHNPSANPEDWGVVAEAARLKPRGPWGVGTVYAIGDAVERDGNGYVSLTSANTGNDPTLDAEEAHWSLLVKRGAPGEGVAGPPGITWRGAYSSATNYKLRDVVMRSGSAYISLTEGNKEHDPETDEGVHWAILAARGEEGKPGPKSGAGLRWRGTYSHTTVYEPKDVVIREGVYYVALAKGKEHDPPNATWWEVFTGGGPQESKVWSVIAATVGVLPGFTVQVDEFSEANQQVIGFSLHTDGEVTVTVRRNGAAIAHLAGVSASSGSPVYVNMVKAGEGTFAPVQVNPGDYIDVEVEAVSEGEEPPNFSGTLHIRHITWGD